MSFSVTIHGVDAVLDDLAAVPKALDRANQKAINRTLSWVNTRIRREAAGHVGVAQKYLKDRLAVRRATTNRPSGLLWVGLNDIWLTARRFGWDYLRQSKAGVRVGKTLFPKAFKATMPSGHRAAFYRTGRRTASGKPQLHHAFIGLGPQLEAAIRSKHEQAAQFHFHTELQTALNYELNHRPGKAS